LAATEIILVTGDKATLEFVLKDIDGEIINLTGVSSVKFKYKNYVDGTVTTLTGNVVTPPTDGKVTFTFNLTNVSSGDYDCEIEITSPIEILTATDIILHVLPEL